MALGEDPCPIWVWPDSHNHECRIKDGFAGSSVPPPARLLQVPAFSILLVRGDLVHAGAADIDDHFWYGAGGYLRVKISYKRNIRAHMYIHKVGEQTADAIYKAPSYYTSLPTVTHHKVAQDSVF